ncbi:MAG TPA: methionine--tRNA ligase subunit beta [Candidatus Paceibacterota bacterium]|nr:methionine--tRNA ligase subunit beta [Candidatus Paceibacterota bacterium]
MEYMTIDEFKKLEARIGEVISAEEVEGSEKLIKLMLDFGEEKPRQILSGIKAWYKPEDLVGKKMLFVVNLAPREMMGLESQGMLMAVDGVDGAPVFLVPEKEVLNGSRVR